MIGPDPVCEQFFEPTGASPTKSSKRRRTSGGVGDEGDESCSSEGPEETSDRFQSGGTTSITNDDKTEQVCPVCSRTLVTSNRGLNEHIDFCLSRDAIREARSSAGVR